MINYKKDTDNIVTLTLDMKGREHNIINHKVSRAFYPVIEYLKKEKAAGALKGIIITSAKKTFLTGGDLDYLFKKKDAQTIFDYTESLQKLSRELESPGVPVVAAINGTALGTGFELALACHHRIVLDDPKIKLGHPEVNIGIMPANGGVIRLMWLLGIEKAFQVLTSGKKYIPKMALKVGIIDELAKNKRELLEKSKAFLMANSESRRPWDHKGMTIPGGTVQDRKVGRMIQGLAAKLHEQNYGLFPAPRVILETLVEGSKVDFDTACRIQSRNFTKLVLGKEAQNMSKAFWYDFNSIKDGESRPKGYGKFRPKKVGIIGAGQMGSGIAYVCLMNGMSVILKDISKSVAQRGWEYIDKELQAAVDQGKIIPEMKTELLSKIETTENAKEFETCDLVIEAVFENQNVKVKVTKEAEVHMDKYALFATNTSSIPITTLAKSTVRPANFVGLHFFAPVQEVPLVEIVKGEETSDETVARAFDFVKKLKKTPILVKDSWGFYASRVLNTYILEGIYMLEEGYPPAIIENLGLQSGMPAGALAMADDLSMEMVMRYENQAAQNYGPKYIQHPAVEVLAKMMTELNRMGRTTQRGFYEYDVEGDRSLWPGLKEHFGTDEPEIKIEELKERFLFAQVIESVWCLQEKVIYSVPEANLGSILGWGFPAYKGGSLQYINDYGVEKFYKKVKEFESTFGPRFSAPKLLKEKAEKGELF